MNNFFTNFLLVFFVIVSLYGVYGKYPRKLNSKRASFHKYYLEDEKIKNVQTNKFLSKSWLSSQIDEVTPKRHEFTDESVIVEKMERKHLESFASEHLPLNVKIQQYWITIQPYFLAPGVIFDSSRNWTFDGYTKIRFTMLQDAQTISVDALNLNFIVTNLYLNGTRQQLISTSYDSNTTRLTLTPVLFFKSNQTYELEFNYTGLINDYTNGGLFFSYWKDQNWQLIANNQYIIATFFEIGYGARSMFPCFDAPSFKAQFTVTFIYPTAFQALGNTRINTTEIYGNGYTKSTFETTPIMSTYLLALATGDFVSRSAVADDGTAIGVYTWNGPNMIDRISVAMDTTLLCYNSLKKYMNVTLPLKKLDHLALPFFSYGGMENWGLIIYDADPILFHNQVFFDDFLPLYVQNFKEDTTAEREFGIEVRCHEMAHQWFGDLVTAAWFTDIMLHESVADYFDLFSIALMYPNQSKFADHLYVINSVNYALLNDYGPSTHPLIVQGGSFDFITYAKGGSLIRQLSFTLGATAFHKALQRYLSTYQYSNANHTQFFDQFTIIAKDSAITDWCGDPLDVNVLMNAWVNVPHYPGIVVTVGDDGHSYVTGQQPFLPLAYLPPGYNYSWIIPTRVLEYIIPYDTAAFSTWVIPNTTQCANFAKAQTHALTSADHYDIYNEGAYTYARVLYEEAAHNRILQIVRMDNGTIPINTKIRLINDEWAIIDRDMDTLGIAPKLQRGLQIVQDILTSSTSVHLTTFMTAQPVLDTIFALSRDRHEFDLYLRFFTPILTNFYKNFGGWTSNYTDFNTGMLRSRFLHYAVRFDIGDARQQAINLWNNRNNQNSTIDPDLRRAVYCAAILNDDGPVFNETKAMFLEAENTGYYTSREINSLVQGMTCAQNPQIITQILDLFVDRANASYRYNIYPAVANFYYNHAASDVMAQYLVDASQNAAKWSLVFDGYSCYTKNSACTLYYFLNGMTGLWYTDSRMQQFKELNNTIYANLNSLNISSENLTDILYYFNYYNVYKLIPDNMMGAYTYADMTRWLYDNYVPFGKTPWVQQLNQTFTPVEYDLSVRPYFPSSYRYNIGQNFTFDGNITISAIKYGPETSISFNSHRHMINHLRVYLANGTQLSTEIRWIIPPIRDYDNSIVTINLTQPIQAGTSIFIVINYTGLIVNNPSEGDYMNWDDLEWSKQQSWIFTTDLEGGPGPRTLAPCYDEPHYKAIWKVTAQYPTDMVALANALEDKTVNLGNGLAQTTFKPTPKMSSYLLALSIGDFASVRGVTKNNMLVRVWTWTGMQNNGELALRAAIDTINYHTTNMNKSLPLEKLDVLALPQYTGYSAGAMENWGLIISGYRSCLWNPDYSTTQQLTDTYWTISHETTHQWFGDLVTFDWWNYIFLNEGFATYWPTAIMAATYNQTEWAHFRRFNDQETALANDGSLESTSPVIPNATQLANFCVFCYQSYEKASSLIFMIEQTITRPNFDKALQNYLNAHALNNTIDTDLFEKFTETAMADYPNIYDWNYQPLNVTNFVRPFFYLLSSPVIKIVTSPDGFSFSYQQTPSVQNGLPNTTVFLWNLPLFTDPPQQYINWLISQKSLENSNTGGWNVVNPRRRVYARIWYDDLSWASILAQIQSNLTVFDPITRAAFISDNWALANQQSVPWSRILTLIKYAGNVPELATWDVVNRVFDQFLVVFKFTADYTKLTTFILSLVNAPSQQSLLFSHTGNWANDITAVYITELLCYLGSTNCLNNASATFNTFIANCQNSAYGTGRCNQVLPDHRITQLCYGLRQNPGSATAVFNLVQWYIKNAPLADYWRNDAIALTLSLSCLTDNNAINSYLNLTLYDQLPDDFFQFVAESDASGMRLFNFFQTNVVKIVASRHFGRIVSNIAYGWSTQAQISLLQNFNWNGITLTTDQAGAWIGAINQVQRNIDWLAQNQPAISAWLNSNF